MNDEQKRTWERIHQNLAKANAGLREAIEKLKKAGLL